MFMEGKLGVDWCHICGRRSSGMVGIAYPTNAEHADGTEKYIRICGVCITRLHELIQP